jgi:hypothetical protein
MKMKGQRSYSSKTRRKHSGQPDPDRIDSFKINPGGVTGDIPIAIKTSLTKKDIRSLPLVAFHGAKAADMRYFEDDPGVFYGHFVFQKRKEEHRNVKEFLQKLFDGTLIDFMKLFFQGATFPALKEFGASGHKDVIDEGKFPLILIITNPEMERQTTMASVGRNDLAALIQISRAEMDQAVGKALEIPEGEPGWDIGRDQTLMHGLYQMIAQKIVDTLEKIARDSATEDKP